MLRNTSEKEQRWTDSLDEIFAHNRVIVFQLSKQVASGICDQLQQAFSR